MTSFFQSLPLIALKILNKPPPILVDYRSIRIKGEVLIAKIVDIVILVDYRSIRIKGGVLTAKITDILNTCT